MKKILGAALGDCVHVGGLHHFLKLAESEGFITESLGPAVSVERIIDHVKSLHPDIVAISYRLTAGNLSHLINDLFDKVKSYGIHYPRFIFGGPPPVALIARNSGYFEKVFDGSESENEIRAFLKGEGLRPQEELYPGDLISRINQKFPYPLLRHHFGLPTLEDTIEGIKKISMEGVLDIISLGPDQNAQEFFFRQQQMNPALNGTGGVPVRSYEDMQSLYEASRCGNYPLMRCYSGTQDLIKWAEMSVQTIKNAWGAIPLCWYSVIDGRSDRSLREAIAENQSAMRWYAQQGIPVEVNESHQWSLRDAHDSLAVTMAYLAASNAKKAGVRNYVSQFMFNTPPGTSFAMDLAKMLAKLELIESLEDESFTVYREVRAGIAHFASNAAIAKGQLASSALISLALKPHILHVVGFSEGDHAIHPEELIESCNIVHGVLRNGLFGLPEFTSDAAITERKEMLKRQSRIILDAVQFIGRNKPDPLSDPDTIALAIEKGILDAPNFKGNRFLKGEITTRIINGACFATDAATGVPIGENERLRRIILH